MVDEKPFYLSSGVIRRPASGVGLDVGGRRLLGFSTSDYIYVGELARVGGFTDAGMTSSTSVYATFVQGFQTNLQALYTPPTGWIRRYRMLGMGYASVVTSSPVLSFKLFDDDASQYVDDTGGTDIIASISFSAVNKMKSAWSNEFQQGTSPDFEGGSTRVYVPQYALSSGTGTVNALEFSLHVFWKKS
jgi:hypothetical protein